MGHSTSSGKRESEEQRAERQANEYIEKLEQLKPGDSMEIGNASYEAESITSIKKILKMMKDDNDGYVVNGASVAVEYSDGSVKVAGDGDKIPSLNGARSVIIDGEYGYTFAGKNIRFTNNGRHENGKPDIRVDFN